MLARLRPAPLLPLPHSRHSCLGHRGAAPLRRHAQGHGVPQRQADHVGPPQRLHRPRQQEAAGAPLRGKLRNASLWHHEALPYPPPLHFHQALALMCGQFSGCVHRLPGVPGSCSAGSFPSGPLHAYLQMCAGICCYVMRCGPVALCVLCALTSMYATR